MSPSFLTLLIGVFKSTHTSLARLNDHPLFDPQLLGLIYPYAAPMKLQKRDRLLVNNQEQCVSQGIMYLGFLDGPDLSWINLRNNHDDEIHFDLRLPTDQRTTGICGFALNEAEQQWILLMDRQNTHQVTAEVYSKQGKFIRFLSQNPIELGDTVVVGSPQFHPPSQQILFCNRHSLIGLHWSTGTVTIIPHHQFSWWKAHPTENVVIMHEPVLSTLALFEIPWGICRWRVKIYSNPCLMWSPHYQGIWEWNPKKPAQSLRRWSLEGELQRVDPVKRWPLEDGCFEAEGCVFQDRLDLYQNDGEPCLDRYHYTYEAF